MHQHNNFPMQVRGRGHARIIAVSMTLSLAIFGAACSLASASTATFGPQVIKAPQWMYTSSSSAAGATCSFPDGTGSFLHCYTPADIRAAYGLDAVPPLSNGEPNYGQGQTIVLVDAYGSPTAAADLQHFHDTFFPNLPNPNFSQVFPEGNPQISQSATSCANGILMGPCSAPDWAGESTLDIEWAYAVAPEAHIILLVAPNPDGANLYTVIKTEIAATPPGTVFSMSFGASELAYGGQIGPMAANFDAVFKQGLAKHDNFFASSGDSGSDMGSPSPDVQYPATSPYVVAVGGTQLQYGWTWTPASNAPFVMFNNSDARYLNPAYWASTPGGNTESVWNESWIRAGTGGGASTLYSRPSWQAGVGNGYGNHRLIPDTAWNAAVNGGVDVWITAYPKSNCGNTTGCWSDYGGTSASAPQTAALVALVNAARSDIGKQPLGFLDTYLYQGIGASTAYTDVTPRHDGSAPKTFAGTDVGISGPVYKSAGDLVDNQLWGDPVAGYATTSGWDATTGWGVPNAGKFVSALVAQP